MKIKQYISKKINKDNEKNKRWLIKQFESMKVQVSKGKIAY